MKLFIAGPMGGLPEYNYPAFHAAEAKLRAAGFEVLSPARISTNQSDMGEPCYWWLRRTIPLMLKCDGVAMLPEAERSDGAQREIQVAAWCALPVWPVERWLRDGREA